MGKGRNGPGLPNRRELAENYHVTQNARGKVPADHSVLPARLGALMASVAEIIELHMKALDLKNKKARKEYKSYARLAKEHRDISLSLQGIAGELERFRKMAQGKANADALSDANILAAFEKFMKAEKKLIGLLQKRMHRNLKTLSPRKPKG